MVLYQAGRNITNNTNTCKAIHFQLCRTGCYALEQSSVGKRRERLNLPVSSRRDTRCPPLPSCAPSRLGGLWGSEVQWPTPESGGGGKIQAASPPALPLVLQFSTSVSRGPSRNDNTCTAYFERLL